jgi:hypothetical protein
MASGSVPDVVSQVKKQLAAITYLQPPEKGICEAAGKVILDTLAGYQGTVGVNVAANGHGGANGADKYQNLSITVGVRISSI